MKKAVFIDYMGTLMRYEGSDLRELIDCFVENSILKSAQEVDSWWSNERIRQEEIYSGDDFRNEDEICMNILEKAERELNLKADIDHLHKLIQSHWMYGNFYSDAAQFLERTTLPVYILSNFGGRYVRVALKRKSLHVNAIYSSEEAKVHKPRKEFYEYALKQAGLTGEEAILIASRPEDLAGALECGIAGILVDRTGMYPKGNYYKVRNLEEASRFIK